MINKNRKGIYTFCGKFSSQSYKNGHIVLLLAALFLVGCQNNSETQEANTEEVEKIAESESTDDWRIDEEEMPLKEELDMLTDSITSFREQAFASEHEKLETTLKLIEEIEQSLNSYDASALASIKKLQANAQAAMYDSASLGSEEVMLKYDEETSFMIEALSEFVANTAEFEKHARAKLLLNDIMKADQSDFRIRNTLYNDFVMRYNSILSQKADEISALGGKYEKLEKQPLFYGGPAS